MENVTTGAVQETEAKQDVQSVQVGEATKGVVLDNKNRDLNETVTLTAVTRNATARAYLGMDLGSTGTRTNMFSSNGAIDKTIEVGSEYKEVNKDISHIPNMTDKLVDQLEIIMEDVSPTGSKEKVFETKHIVKGNLVKDVEGVIPRTTSSSSKANQETTYVNAIANVAIRLLIAQTKSDRFQEYEVDLTVSLPPADISSRKVLDEFKEKLSGSYSVLFPRIGKIGVTVNFTITKERILVESEALAVLRYWAIHYRQDMSNFPRALVFDGGGRSFDIGCIENGRFRGDASSSTQFGANRMQSVLAEEYVNETGNSKPNKSMLEEAIQTGFMQKGNSYLPVKKELGTAKTQIAKDLMTHINDVFDANEDLNPDQINLIIVAGGAFKTTGAQGSEGYVPSLMAFLKKEYGKISADTKFSIIKEQNPIPQGLAYYRISKGF